MLLFINIYGERQRHKIMPTIRSCEGMDVSGDDPDLAKTVLTCEGDLRDPAFPNRLTQIICKLKRLVADDNKKPFQVTKVEPWNSVRVTFNIPRNAAQRLRQLAQRGDNTLRELGILSVQIEGDQVITLTLANSFDDNRQQLVVVKSSENVVNSAVTSSAVNSSININSSELTVNFNNTNILTPNSVSSVVSSNDLIGSPSIGSSVEITRKNIAQYLSQPHIDVVNSTVNSAEPISGRLPAFLSPNVVAPINTEPIPFLNSNSTTTVTSQLSTSVLTTNTCSVSSSAGSRLTAVTSASNNLRDIQSNYGLFPFASMQHSYQAMHTKHFTSVQRLNQVITAPVPMSQTTPNSTGIATATVSSTITSSSNRPQMTNRDAKNIKVCSSVVSTSQHSVLPQSSQTPPQSSHSKASSVSPAVSQSCSAANNQSSASANVALTSPLLVNLLQSDATTGHMKGSSGQSSALNQINATNDLNQKRKPRKSRKSKEKIELEVTQTSDLITTTPLLSSTQTSLLTTLSTSSQKHLPSNSLPQQSGIDPQMQTQSSFNISNISPHLISIPLNTMSRFPSIHPEAQGQPQVVRAGQLPLRSQLSRPQISATKVGSPQIVTTQLHKPLVTTSQDLVSKPYPMTNTHSKPLLEQKSSPNPNSANNKSVTSGSDSNAVFSSPPPSRLTGKTKHLINPFTGLLEPMLSDEEEEDRPSPATLFPELDAGSDVGGNSERSLSDAGSNGKDNNHSSDDSGLGKSGTDVSSQSSIEVVNDGNTPTNTRDITSKVCIAVNENMSSSDSTTDRLKLKVKIEAKNECLKGDISATTSSSVSPFPSRSHNTKQKSSESSNSSSNQLTSQTDVSPVLMAEPRVPPLHISIRGPNSAVVVSNRRESTSELEMKTNVTKKARGVRTARAMSVESGLGTECTNLNKNQRKKLQREQRFLSGGGIVTTSALSVSASPSGVESLVDLNQTLNDSSFALSLSATTPLSESLDRVLLQSSDVSSNCAQNKCKDLAKDNLDNNNISINKCVPLLPNEDNNSSQLCAIHTTTDTIKTSVDSSDQTIYTNTTTDSSLSAENTTLSMTTNSDNNKIKESSVSENVSPPQVETNTITEDKIEEPSALTNQTVEPKPQLTTETTDSEPIVSNSLRSSSPTNDQKVEESKSSDKLEVMSEIITVASVISVEPLIDANPEHISKISRIGINCMIPPPIPSLIDPQEVNSVPNNNCLQTTETNSFGNYLIESTTKVECNESLETNQNVFTKTENNSNTSERSDDSLKNIVISETSESTDKSIEQKSEILLNGEDSNLTNVSSIASIEMKSIVENELESKGSEQQPEDEAIVSSKELTSECNTEKEGLISTKNDILSEVRKEKITDNNQTVLPINDLVLNSDVSNEIKCENTAISVDSTQNLSKNIEKEDFVDSEVEKCLSKTIVSDSGVKSNERNEESIKTNCNESKNSETIQPINTKINLNDETVKQPLQIMIASTVPSLTTTTTTPVFSQFKSTSLESGSRVTLITFKSNLNSPNTSSSSGKSSEMGNNSSPLQSKGVPFKLLTIPSGSGGITVRSAANKLVELINSTASSPVSPLSPNHSSGSPIPLNTTSPPVRLLVSKVATSGGVNQTGVPVSVAGNSIGQLVVVKSVVVTNPSPSIKLVPAKTARTTSVNTPSLLIPVTQTNSTIESLNAINNSEQKPQEMSHSMIINEITNSDDTIDNNHNSSHQNDSHINDINDSDSMNSKPSPSEPVDLTVQCSEGLTVVSSGNEIDDETVPLLIKSSDLTENDLSDEEENEDNILTHSVASDHNYNMKKSSDESEVTEDDSLLNLSNSTETNNFDLKDSETIDDESKSNDIHSMDRQMTQSPDPKSRPNKRKSSENAAELIKACMGVDDIPKKNSSLSYLPSFGVSSGLSPRVANCSTKTRPPVDNESVDTIISDSSEANHLNKTKNLRIRKNKNSSTESGLTAENNCSSDEEITIRDNPTLSWANKPRLRTGSATKNQKIAKQNNINCVKTLNKEKNTNRSNERPKRSRERDQNKSSSTQRSTRRSRDHNIMISSAGINLHTSESSSESLHMEIVGLELSNESPNNNYNNDPSSASTTPPIITSSLLVKRKTRVGINNNTEQTESGLTKRRRIVKENHR